MKHGAAKLLLRLIPSTLLAFHLFPAAAGGPEPIKIPVVKTYGELLATTPVREEEFAWPKAAAGKDAMAPKIHLGISRLSSDLHDAVILYLLIEEPVPPKMIEGYEDNLLGPFSVQVERPREEQMLQLKAMEQMARAASMDRPEGGHRLFLKVVPLDAAGTWKIGLQGLKGKIFAEAKITASKESAPVWVPWVPPLKEQQAQEKLQEEEEDPITVEEVSNPKGGAAYPSAKNQGGQIVSKNINPKADLPALWPETPHPKARCYAETNLLTAQLDQPYEIMFPLDHFLTRWWVNGKPAKLSVKEGVADSARAWSGQVPNEDQFQFSIQFDAARLKAKEGDIIGVQLLFCPGGFEYGEARANQLFEAASAFKAMDLSVLLPRVNFVWKDGKLQPKGS